MRARRQVAAALLAVALGSSGCGSRNASTTTRGGEAVAATDDADTTPVDACSYLSAAEVTAITTDKVDPVREDNSCIYRAKPNDDGLRLTVDLHDGEKQMRAAHNANTVLGGLADGAATTPGAGPDAAAAMRPSGGNTPELGDEAAWGTANILSVRKGQAFVQIIPPLIHDPANHSGYPLIGDAEKRKIAVTVAEKVLAKL